MNGGNLRPVQDRQACTALFDTMAAAINGGLRAPVSAVRPGSDAPCRCDACTRAVAVVGRLS